MKTQKFVESPHSVISVFLRFSVGIFIIAVLLVSALFLLVGWNLVYSSAINLLNYRGYFSAWSISESPPSPIEKIVRADANRVIWIETKYGDIYSKYFADFAKENTWQKQKKVNIVHTLIYSEQFGSCKFEKSYVFEEAFSVPPEKITQCVRAEEWYPDSISIWYFALSENGKFWVYQYWQSESFGLVTLCFLAMGITILFLAISRFGLGRLKLRLENAR